MRLISWLIGWLVVWLIENRNNVALGGFEWVKRVKITKSALDKRVEVT